MYLLLCSTIVPTYKGPENLCQKIVGEHNFSRQSGQRVCFGMKKKKQKKTNKKEE
jgi:hypothetical protein